MATYKYRALNPRGRVVGGTLVAASELDLQQQLLQAGMALIEATPFVETASRLALMRPVRGSDLVPLCLNLEQLENAGVKLTDALHDVVEATSHPRLQAVLSSVVQEVDDGASLSRALRHHPAVFPPLMIALIEAGEASGTLANSFHELGEHFRWQDQLQRRLVRVTAYPAFTVFAMLVVMVLMLGFVVPEVTQFLYSLNIKLPDHTLALIRISELAKEYGAGVFSGLLVAALGFYVTTLRSTEMRYRMHAFILRIPLAGAVIRKVSLSRFMHTFSLMFASGLDMTEALNVAAGTVSNPVIAESVSVINEQVQSGNPLSLALKLSGEFPALVQRMVKIGEESGQLAPALRHVAGYYERDVEDTIQNLVTALGPALTLIAAGMLLWVAFAVFVPVYDALPQLAR